MEIIDYHSLYKIYGEESVLNLISNSKKIMQWDNFETGFCDYIAGKLNELYDWNQSKIDYIAKNYINTITQKNDLVNQKTDESLNLLREYSDFLYKEIEKLKNLKPSISAQIYYFNKLNDEIIKKIYDLYP